MKFEIQVIFGENYQKFRFKFKFQRLLDFATDSSDFKDSESRMSLNFILKKKPVKQHQKFRAFATPRIPLSYIQLY